MSLEQIINYDNAGNFTFDTDKIEIAASKAQLKLETTAEPFVENFDSDTGFTYDSDKAEFAGGLVRQKDQRPADATCSATYTADINLNWGDGVLTGALEGSAAVSSGKLDCTNSTTDGAKYAVAGNADFTNIGTIRFKITPNYTGAPGSNSILFYMSPTGANEVFLRHNSSGGNLVLIVRDSGASFLINNTMGAWLPTAGAEYEFEINIDISTGATRLFIDGVQSGSTVTATGSRNASDDFYVGKSSAGSGVNAKFDDIMIFSTVQHTANYTPGYTVVENIYAETAITTAEMEHTNPGTLISFDSFSTDDTNSPRYTVQIGRSGNYLYWDGADWITSDGSYSQATDEATFNTNCADLPVNGEIYGQFKIHFNNSDSQMSVSTLTANLTGNVYHTDNPSIVNNSGVFCDALDSFAATLTESGSDTVTFAIRVGSTDYYFDGSNWVASDLSLAQSNTAAEIEANKASLDLSAGATIKVVAILHSDDGTTTPDLTQVVLDYGFQAVSPTAPSECYVSSYLKDILGDAETGTLVITNEKHWIYNGEISIAPSRKTVSYDSNGYCEIQLVETETDSKKYLFEIHYTDHNGAGKIMSLGYAEVPSQDIVDLATLTFQSDNQ